ncbi:hypothetical protein F511_27751 [Dorcoceras hygrometricum]|uniref:Uncharacterized protein n=1 Tax=Dorcoceras hygrometricum TaxID=472368 RepID=A0A2Z7AUY0_9LAMI|nr:hypothetical protein F511_27751 [Dorcoceras hygrometricum]
MTPRELELEGWKNCLVQTLASTLPKPSPPSVAASCRVWFVVDNTLWHLARLSSARLQGNRAIGHGLNTAIDRDSTVEGPYSLYNRTGRAWRQVAKGIQLAVGPQPLRLRNHNFGLAHRIMIKRLETSPHDPLGITDSACKNQLVVVSVQYDPFYTYIPIRSTTIGKSRVARDPIAMHTSWRSNCDIASVTSIGYPRMKASGESSTTKHRLLHASGPHPIPPPNDPKFDDLKNCFSHHNIQFLKLSRSVRSDRRSEL